MSVVGLGLDLTEVSRIRMLLAKNGDRFTDRLFTAAERAYCESCADPAIHYAARFAAKEAAAKALGTGFASGVSWLDIEITRNAATGAPSLVLHGAAATIAASLGARKMLLSITHTKETAAASVVASE